MNDGIIIGIVGLVVSLIAIVTPIIKLNSNIVKLNTTLGLFQESYEQNHKKLEDRVSNHGKQIDDLEKTAINHDLRIKAVEKEVGKE